MSIALKRSSHRKSGAVGAIMAQNMTNILLLAVLAALTSNTAVTACVRAGKDSGERDNMWATYVGVRTLEGTSRPERMN